MISTTQTRENTPTSDNWWGGEHYVKLGSFFRSFRLLNPGYSFRPVLSANFFSKVRFETSGCWIWTGATWGPPGYPKHKYGTMRIPGENCFRKKICAHKYAYETIFAPVPEGFELDHTCENKLCVNPHHLEVVTHAENIRRRFNRHAGGNQ